jgi:hypothetical protein
MENKGGKEEFGVVWRLYWLSLGIVGLEWVG